MTKIRTLPFFSEWAGHPISDLTKGLSITHKTRPGQPVIFLAGDSSLDNKAWVPFAGVGGESLSVAVPSIYASILDPPAPKPDVAFWLNHFLGDEATCLNTAIEASLLGQRSKNLLPQDAFIRDNIRAQDILIVSVGANDIALSPTASTMRHMAQLAWLTPLHYIENGTASSLKYFKKMFGAQTQTYISRLIEKQKPKAVIVCMIYFPLEGQQSGWAETQLKMLGYNRHPRQLQAAIRKMFEQATAEIKMEGTAVVPCALFEAMDGKDAGDYVARVEPGVQGGRKMAELLNRHLRSILRSAQREVRDEPVRANVFK